MQERVSDVSVEQEEVCLFEIGARCWQLINAAQVARGYSELSLGVALFPVPLNSIDHLFRSYASLSGNIIDPDYTLRSSRRRRNTSFMMCWCNPPIHSVRDVAICSRARTSFDD